MGVDVTTIKNSNNHSQNNYSNSTPKGVHLNSCGELINSKTKLTLGGNIPLDKFPRQETQPQRTIQDDKPSSLWGALRALFFVFM